MHRRHYEEDSELPDGALRGSADISGPRGIRKTNSISVSTIEAAKDKAILRKYVLALTG